MSEKIAAAMMPGSAEGSTISMNTRSRLAPSMSAASSSSTGIERKNAHRSHMQKGSVTDTYPSVRLQSESVSSSFVMTRKSGNTRMIDGTMYPSRLKYGTAMRKR